jgi:phosphoglycolate phosphatase
MRGIVVFDLDGTLADTSRDLIAAANAALVAGGGNPVLDPVADAATAMRGGRAMLRLGYARLGYGGEDEVDLAYPELLRAYEMRIDAETQLFPGAAEAVAALAGFGYGAAVCTNKPERLADILLQRLGVRHLFGGLVGADTLPVRKPDPAPYAEAVARAGGDVARSFLVGDTETDRQTGLAAGVPVALVTFGPEGAGAARHLPEALLHAYADLPALAERLLPG